MNTLPSPRPARPGLTRAVARSLGVHLCLAASLGWAGTSATAQTLPVKAPPGMPLALAQGAPLPAPLVQHIQLLAQEAALTAWPAELGLPRIEIEVGSLNPRLKLAPCLHAEAFLPSHSRPAGRTRIGLRCTQGEQSWQVFVPVQIKLWSLSLVARGPLPMGTVLAPQHLTQAEVDVADNTQTAVGRLADAQGRTLARGLAAGEPLRLADLKSRVWFAAGDVVTATARGTNFAISVEGKAQGPGIEGRPVRMRTEDGRVLTGMAVGDHRIEIPL